MAKSYEETQKQREQDFTRTFNTEQGKRVIDELRKFCKYDAPLNLDTLQLDEGKRQVFLFIKSKIKETLNDRPA